MQFRDLKAQYQALKPEIDAGIQAVIDSTSFILGKPVTELENALAEYVGRKHCVACGNGTDALQLALMVWGIGPGDAVFTSDFTYFASAGSSSILGATPVLVDIDLATFNMDPEDLEKQILRVLAEGKLTPKVIVPVDLFGQPANYDKILPIAAKYGWKTVRRDSAEIFAESLTAPSEICPPRRSSRRSLWVAMATVEPSSRMTMRRMRAFEACVRRARVP